MSGDADVGTGVLTMSSGSLTAAEGPAFYVTNTRAVIALRDGARVSASSGVHVSAIIGDRHTVTYDASLQANSGLHSKSYTLAGDGRLEPA